MKGFWIYKAVNDKGIVIYVGLTTNIKQRMSQHKAKSEWWDEAEYIYYADAYNKTSMKLFEQYYINKYSPKYNKKDMRGDDIAIVTFLKELFFCNEYKYNIQVKYDFNKVNKIKHILKSECRNNILEINFDNFEPTIKFNKDMYSWHSNLFNKVYNKFSKKYSLPEERDLTLEQIEEVYTIPSKVFDRLSKKYIIDGMPCMDVKSCIERLVKININGENEWLMDFNKYDEDTFCFPSIFPFAISLSRKERCIHGWAKTRLEKNILNMLADTGIINFITKEFLEIVDIIQSKEHKEMIKCENSTN